MFLHYVCPVKNVRFLFYRTLLANSDSLRDGKRSQAKKTSASSPGTPPAVSHGGSPVVTMGFNTKSWSHDDDFGVP